jgi:hypothetical protein
MRILKKNLNTGSMKKEDDIPLSFNRQIFTRFKKIHLIIEFFNAKKNNAIAAEITDTIEPLFRIYFEKLHGVNHHLQRTLAMNCSLVVENHNANLDRILRNK